MMQRRSLAELRQSAMPDGSNPLTDLLNAVVLGNEQTAIALIEQQELSDRQREQLLAGAAKFNDRKIVDYLIKSGTRLNWPELTQQYMSAPLNNALTYDYLDLATHLIEQGANVDAEYGSNNTPLNCAVESNRIDACKLLIDHGADVHAPTDGVPPIIRAADGGNLDIVKLLIDNEADPNAKAFGHTPLNDAMARGHTEVVQYLRSLQN